MAIVPIPTTRVGDFFIRQRLVSQVQSDQLELFRLQTQISTGRRILQPSDDAPAALRAMNIQRVLQRKAQVATNLTNSKAVLGAADSSLSHVSSQLNDIRAAALGVADTVSSESDRLAVAQLVDAALESLVSSANANFKGRYLFAGTRTNTLPYDYDGEFVKYLGNTKELQNYVDLDQLFATNIPGTDIFGGRSAEVRGSADLNPHLREDTLLSSINGGEGLGPNAAISVSVTSGSNVTYESIVDLSGAVTIGDVMRQIEANPPAGIGADFTVDIVGNGLTVRTDTGTIRIGEVASGRTARELGIFTPSTIAPSATVVGTDLDPAVQKTTAIGNLLGRKATGRLALTGPNNDLVITAVQNGASFNGVDIVLVDDGTAGAEVADPYNSTTNTLTVHIQSGVTTASQIAAAINAEGTFTAVPDYRDATSTSAAGVGPVSVVGPSQTFTDITTDGTGTAIDLGDGIILTNGGETVTLDLSEAETVEDVLNLITGAGVGLIGEINETGTGINVRSVLSGADFTIGEAGGQTATQLGIRTYTGSTALSSLNRGVGVPTNDFQSDTFTPVTTSDLVITARDGTILTVDLDTATTLDDVANLINTATGNQTGTTFVTASITADGHGITLTDSSTTTLNDLTVQGNAASEALGFLNAGAASIADSTIDVSGNYSLTSYRHSLEDDLGIVARDGTELWVDLTGTATVQDVIDRINNHVRNNTNGTAVLARLAENGNGIELVDTSTATTGALTVRNGELSQAASLLGFVPDGAAEATSTSGSGGGDYTLATEDRHTLEVDSVFNSLIRLKAALIDGDPIEIGRSIGRIDADISKVTFARAEIGSRLQALDVVGTRLDDENVQLQSALSQDLDVDLVEAITNLTAKQYALQASLQTVSSILNLSLLDYI